MKGNKIILPVFHREDVIGIACIPYQFILDKMQFGYTKEDKEVEFHTHDETCAIHSSSEIDAECSCDATLEYLCDYKEFNGRLMPIVTTDDLVSAEMLVTDTNYLVQRTNNIYFMK